MKQRITQLIALMLIGFGFCAPYAVAAGPSVVNKNTTEKVIAAPDPSPQLAVALVAVNSIDPATALVGLANTAPDANTANAVPLDRTDQQAALAVSNTAKTTNTGGAPAPNVATDKTRANDQLLLYAAVGNTANAAAVNATGDPAAG